MMLSQEAFKDDAAMRAVYVGITRAKKRLHIHYTGMLMDEYISSAVETLDDNVSYPKPSELIMHLTHKDVFLDFFKDKKSTILRLRSGMRLKLNRNQLCICGKTSLMPVGVLSKKCRDEIQKYMSRGYTPYDATIRFICAWNNKDIDEEVAVILADLYFHNR